MGYLGLTIQTSVARNFHPYGIKDILRDSTRIFRDNPFRLAGRPASDNLCCVSERIRFYAESISSFSDSIVNVTEDRFSDQALYGRGGDC